MQRCKRQMPAAFIAVVVAVACVNAQTYPPTVSVPTAAPAAQLPIASLTVPAFSSIDVCLPVNVLVVPTTSTDYTVTAGAEQEILQALSASVEAGVLYLQSYGMYTTNNIVTLQVSVPANNLAGVALNSRAQVSVAQGFTAPDFTVTVNGSGDVYALGVSTETLTVNLRGEGNVLVNGTIGDATVDSTQGEGDVYVIGTTRSVTVRSSGDGDIKLRNANANVAMTGMSTGDGDVDYNVGNCNVMQSRADNNNDNDDDDDDDEDTSGGTDDNACDQDRISLPNLNPMWSCGISVTRSFACAAGPRQAQSIAAASGMATNGPGMPPATPGAAAGAAATPPEEDRDNDNDDRAAAGATQATPATPAGGDPRNDNDDDNDDNDNDSNEREGDRRRQLLQIDDRDDDADDSDDEGFSAAGPDDDNDDDDDDRDTQPAAGLMCSATTAQRMIFVA